VYNEHKDKSPRRSLSCRKVVTMKVSYNKIGIPFLIDNDGTIVDFTPANSNEIIGGLATNKKVLDELLSASKQVIANSINEYNKEKKENFYELNKAFSSFSEVGRISIVVNICESAEDLYLQLSNPSPHKKWHWNSVEKVWEAPTPIPAGKPGEIYEWKDDPQGWHPVAPLPGPNWVWSTARHEWIPSVPYPLDAAPGEFVWDHDQDIWVLSS